MALLKKLYWILLYVNWLFLAIWQRRWSLRGGISNLKLIFERRIIALTTIMLTIINTHTAIFLSMSNHSVISAKLAITQCAVYVPVSHYRFKNITVLIWNSKVTVLLLNQGLCDVWSAAQKSRVNASLQLLAHHIYLYFWM